MTFFPIFLSVIFVIRNQEQHLEKLLSSAISTISTLVSDYELIIIDNASTDHSIAVLKKLTQENGLPNLQVYALTKTVDTDTASWVGIENALGDYVAVIDPMIDDITFLPQMLDNAVEGNDVVFAHNKQKIKQGIFYQSAQSIFNNIYKWFNDIHLAKDAPSFRILSKKIVNFILQHPHPNIAYRHLPATSGFARSNLTYHCKPQMPAKKSLKDSIERGVRLLVSTTRGPMRLVTFLSLFGAAANLIYSVYVVAVGLFKTNVAPGWISLSLQQSGMFFLITLVLFVLGEYILHMASLSTEGPPYHVAQEFNSATITRREKLNIEQVFFNDLQVHEKVFPLF